MARTFRKKRVNWLNTGPPPKRNKSKNSPTTEDLDSYLQTLEADSGAQTG